jgi:hypothetical protein
MKFKGKSNGANIICVGSLDQEIFDRGTLAVFEELLGFCHDIFVFNISQSYRANSFSLNEI